MCIRDRPKSIIKIVDKFRWGLFYLTRGGELYSLKVIISKRQKGRGNISDWMRLKKLNVMPNPRLDPIVKGKNML